MRARSLLLVELGEPLIGLTIEELTTPGVGLQVGIEPLRIDVLTKISGISFSEAWASRIEADFDGVRSPVIGLDALLVNKQASGRPQDLADVAALEKVRARH